ncbi:MAG: hypothetical protein ACI8SJ_002007 [Shewanella sp.]|jgi:hypothetical protein
MEYDLFRHNCATKVIYTITYATFEQISSIIFSPFNFIKSIELTLSATEAENIGTEVPFIPSEPSLNV